MVVLLCFTEWPSSYSDEQCLSKDVKPNNPHGPALTKQQKARARCYVDLCVHHIHAWGAEGTADAGLICPLLCVARYRNDWTSRSDKLALIPRAPEVVAQFDEATDEMVFRARWGYPMYLKSAMPVSATGDLCGTSLFATCVPGGRVRMFASLHNDSYGYNPLPTKRVCGRNRAAGDSAKAERFNGMSDRASSTPLKITKWLGFDGQEVSGWLYDQQLRGGVRSGPQIGADGDVQVQVYLAGGAGFIQSIKLYDVTGKTLLAQSDGWPQGRRSSYTLECETDKPAAIYTYGRDSPYRIKLEAGVDPATPVGKVAVALRANSDSQPLWVQGIAVVGAVETAGRCLGCGDSAGVAQFQVYWERIHSGKVVANGTVDTPSATFETRFGAWEGSAMGLAHYLRCVMHAMWLYLGCVHAGSRWLHVAGCECG